MLSSQNKIDVYFYFINEQNRLNKKMYWLLSKKRNTELEKIQQVQYFWKELQSQSDVTETAKHYSFALSPHRNYPDTFDSASVTLHPSSFVNFQLLSSISSKRDK